MYSCRYCDGYVTCQNRTSFNKHLRIHINTDVKFLKSLESPSQLDGKKEIVSGTVESKSNNKQDLVDFKLDKKYTVPTSEKSLTVKYKTECYEAGLGVSSDEKMVGVNTQIFANESSNMDIDDIKSTSSMDTEMKWNLQVSSNMSHETIKREIPDKIDVGKTMKTEILNSELKNIKLQKHVDSTLDKCEKINEEADLSTFETMIKGEFENKQIKNEGPAVEFEQEYFESQYLNNCDDMKLDEKYKKEISDMEFEEKCRREITESNESVSDILHQSISNSAVGELNDTSSLDEDFDEDFEDEEIYDDEFSDQYNEIDQLSLSKSEHEQKQIGESTSIDEILAKYRTVISTKQVSQIPKDQCQGVSNGLPSHSTNQEYTNKKDSVAKPRNSLIMKESSQLGADPSVIVSTENVDRGNNGLAGKSMVPKATSLDKKPHKSKSNEVSCDICFKKLHSNYTLKNHMLLHTGEKPFNCGQCEETFRRKPQLVSHMNKSHGFN